MEMQATTRDIYVTVSVRLPVNTYEQVAELAQEHRGNLSEALRRLLAKGLDQGRERNDELVHA